MDKCGIFDGRQEITFNCYSALSDAVFREQAINYYVIFRIALRTQYVCPSVQYEHVTDGLYLYGYLYAQSGVEKGQMGVRKRSHNK